MDLTKPQRMKWIGQVVKEVFKGGVLTKKGRGRPRSRWWDEVKKDICQLGICNWQRGAEDRDRWMAKVH